MRKTMVFTSISVILSYGLMACGGGGGSSSSSTVSGKPGFSAPTEISAVPTDTSAGSGKPNMKSGMKSKMMALKEAASDPDTDYSKATTVKFVNEHTLKQFDIVEDVLKALAQTNYADEENVGAGPYKAMIAFQDEQNGVQTKSLEPWVVQSDMIEENGTEVNRVRIWIEDPEMGGVLKGEFKITQSATKRSDGSYKDYGVWTLNVKFDSDGTSFFAASAAIDANGRSVIKVHEKQVGGGPGGGGGGPGGGPPPTMEMKAIMNRSETEGFGQVSFPDFQCGSQGPCTPTTVVAKYAYNANHLAVKKGSEATQFKDRTDITEMTHRYGMFDSVTGQDVLKTKSFGFPVEYTNTGGERRFSYYGAWQGRHQLWTPEGSIPAGTTVTRQDRGPQQTRETYTTSAPFVGTLTKRTAVAASINDIKGIPVETWINSNFELRYQTSPTAGWYECTHTFDPNTGFFNSTCGSQFTAFDSLTVGENDRRKFVMINRCDNCGPNSPPTNYLYLKAGTFTVGQSTVTISQDGFYVADMTEGRSTLRLDQQGQPTRLTEANGIQLWVNIGGSIYIMYNGSSFVEKTLVDFDTDTWTPEFDEAGDKPYTLPADRELYINSRGANYIVKRTGASTYDVKIEIQTTANPVNATTFVPAGTVFKSQWNPEGESTFEFITDPASNKFMKLVYKTIGQTDSQSTPTPSVGDVVTSGRWGLVAYNSGGQSTNIQFNWDYPREGDMFGSQQYLLDSNNNYVLLSDPIRLLPKALTNNAGEEKTLSLQYDGWMHGLPDLFFELSKNSWVMTSDISDKIINIEAGTEFTDADDSSKTYLVKPLEMSQFLDVVSDPGNLDISVADGVDLGTVPNFVEHNMGAMPDTTGVKYSEGKLVE